MRFTGSIILIFTVLSVSSSLCFAGCEKPAPGYDSVYCSAKLFLESDNELNAAWKQLMPLLSPEQKKSSIQAQRDWIKYRNAKCSTENSINVDCNFDVNKERTKFLLDRITECKIGSCNESLLFKNTWE